MERAERRHGSGGSAARNAIPRGAPLTRSAGIREKTGSTAGTDWPGPGARLARRYQHGPATRGGPGVSPGARLALVVDHPAAHHLGGVGRKAVRLRAVCHCDFYRQTRHAVAIRFPELVSSVAPVRIRSCDPDHASTNFAIVLAWNPFTT